ncbi:hypothetical protein BJY04DRAFT_188933 [Aspergillus karnatakaensis]|uniref:uncharacterized protein n=1 Tax=Aspergillus karnatakaensis TaxID=1810916 RepID=UPI003CCC981E
MTFRCPWNGVSSQVQLARSKVDSKSCSLFCLWCFLVPPLATSTTPSVKKHQRQN